LVDSVESMMMHRLSNPKSNIKFEKSRCPNNQMIMLSKKI